MKTDRSTMLTLAILAAVLAVTFLVYRPGLSGPLLLDDMPQLDGLIKESGADPATLFRNYIISTSGPSGRPVAMASFIADAVAHGPDIWWWKYDNLMFHMISGLLVFWLTALLFQASATKTGVGPWIVGVIVGSLWLLHPLHVSTVLYTVQRMTELSAMFVLAGLVCYVKGRLVQDQFRSIGWLLIGVGFAVFYPLAIFSKENALMFPVFCSLIELLVFRFRGSAPVARQVKVFHGILLVGYLAVGILFLANFSSIVLDSYAARDFTLPERVLTQFRVTVMYLSMLLLPIQRNMGFFHDDLTVSTGLFDPFTTVLSALFLLALIASGIVLKRRMPLYGLGILFFFASHAIESSVLGLELMFEHRNYIGSVGILIAVVSVGLSAKEHTRGMAFIAAISVIGFSLLTWQRSLTWSSPDYMYQYMYRVHPESPRLNIVFGNLFAAAKEYQRANEYLDKGKPGLGLELHRLFFDCLEHQSVERGALSRISRIQEGVIDVHAITSADSLVNESVSGRCDVPRNSLVGVLDHLLASRSPSSTNVIMVLFIKARLLDSMGQIDAAVDQYLAAQELSDNDALPLYMAAGILSRAGQLDAARSMLTRAYDFEKSTRIRRRTISEQIYSALGSAYEKEGRLETALAVYAEALTSMPSRTLFYLKTAKVLLDMQRYEESREMLDDLRNGNLADLKQYEYAMQRISTELARLSQ